jgi:hypothetical protein
MTMEQIRISGKNLGALALESFCPRCFWLKMHCKELPYQIFPGIFSSIDSYTKKVTHIHYEECSAIPGWLRQFGDLVKPVKTPTHYSFYVVDTDTNIRLTGVPDEIFQMKDGSFFIADYKTAKYTGTQDKLLPMYKIQLNAYGYIGNKTDYHPVTGIGLVYYEPQTELSEESLDSVLTEDGFKLAFQGKLLPLELAPEKMIPPLLRKVREIYDRPRVPEGAIGCEDCERLDKLINLAAG